MIEAKNSQLKHRRGVAGGRHHLCGEHKEIFRHFTALRSRENTKKDQKPIRWDTSSLFLSHRRARFKKRGLFFSGLPLCPGFYYPWHQVTNSASSCCRLAMSWGLNSIFTSCSPGGSLRSWSQASAGFLYSCSAAPA